MLDVDFRDCDFYEPREPLICAGETGVAGEAREEAVARQA
jgi:hypothetical protein